MFLSEFMAAEYLHNLHVLTLHSSYLERAISMGKVNIYDVLSKHVIPAIVQ